MTFPFEGKAKIEPHQLADVITGRHRETWSSVRAQEGEQDHREERRPQCRLHEHTQTEDAVPRRPVHHSHRPTGIVF